MTATMDHPSQVADPASAAPEPISLDERNALIEDHLGLAYSLADRYTRPTVSREDLRQVAAEALTKAADRYDPQRGPFSTYATPYICGSIKRFFRDHAWAVRPPRDLQERTLRMFTVSEELAQQLGRAPTATELADAMHCTRDEAIAAIECGATYTATCLDTTDSEHLSARAIASGIAETERIDDLICLAPLIASLPERDRLMLSLRFGQEMTQTQIAERLGVSQMQVSRLLSTCLTKLRHGLLPDAA